MLPCRHSCSSCSNHHPVRHFKIKCLSPVRRLGNNNRHTLSVLQPPQASILPKSTQTWVAPNNHFRCLHTHSSLLIRTTTTHMFKQPSHRTNSSHDKTISNNSSSSSKCLTQMPTPNTNLDRCKDSSRVMDQWFKRRDNPLSTGVTRRPLSSSKVNLVSISRICCKWRHRPISHNNTRR